MNPLVALAVATPIWGFALQPPMAPSIATPPAAQVRSTVVVHDDVTLATDPDLEAQAEAVNETWMNLTRAASVAGVVGLALTSVFGAMQYRDEYGFHDEWSQTACAQNDPIFDLCGTEQPWYHLAAVIGTAFFTLGGLGASTQVDFDRAARRDGDWRTYEVTRWLSHGLIALQALGGFFLANAVNFGWADQQRDFDVLNGFAIAHLGLGVAALAFETYNTILIF